MKYYFLLGLGSVPFALRAQSSVASSLPPTTPKSGVSFGAKLGVNYSNTNFNQGSPKPVVPVATTWKTGFAGGFWVRLPVHGKFAVQQEYLFSQLSGEISNGGPRYTLRYLSLPLLLRYALVPRVALVAGPQFDLLINSQQDSSGQKTTITHDTEERGIGATAGVEVSLLPNFSLNARYLQGLNHIGIGQRSTVQEFKFQSVQVTLDARF
ncbi:MAG: outer membrane beta-barrel protein [Janthinobacterium lividum]